MKEIVFTLNGLTLEAIFLEDCLNMRKIFYLQGRIILTDEGNNEIRSMDIIHTIRALQDNRIKVSWCEI